MSSEKLQTCTGRDTLDDVTAWTAFSFDGEIIDRDRINVLCCKRDLRATHTHMHTRYSKQTYHHTDTHTHMHMHCVIC